ncbi:MAG: cupin domain-containing protein [Mucilaginibacter sp.]|nr:cupin domain-containing protein [Mucilaginibacter sp.]
MKFTHPEKIKNIETRGIRVTVILSTERSDGKLTILENEVGIGAASPMHSCKGEDKVILVNEGKFLFNANGEQYLAEKGCNIHIPNNTMYSFENIGTVTGKLLITLTPKVNETFSKDVNQSIVVRCP